MALVGLVESIESLSSDELYALAERFRISLDPSKRISMETQLARGLVILAHARNPALLPRTQAELVWRVAEAQGALPFDVLPAAAQPLIEAGLLFRASCTTGTLLQLPLAYLAQMNVWEGDDPRGVRALLSQTPSAVAAAVAGEYLGRPATLPTCLSLEPALRALLSPERLAAALSALPPAERQLLSAIEERGGEVDTEELLDLEQEPLRLRGAAGVTQSRKSLGYALERRGFLIPLHPNHHVIPTEVVRIVGRSRRQVREKSRAEIRRSVFAQDHAPRRASFSSDPAWVALAFALSVRKHKTTIKPERGTPKSLVHKLAARHGCSPDTVALIAALSRALGLWGDGALSETTPPGALAVGDLGECLFQLWRKGGSWDEAREHGEVLRVSTRPREASAVGVIRELMLEVLCELGEGRWVPWQSVAGYLLADTRHEALTRLLYRWAQRNAQPPVSVADLATRIGLQTLHSLGVVDVGDEEEPGMGPALRVTPRGRSWIDDTRAVGARGESSFIGDDTLRIGPNTTVSQTLALSPLVEIGRVAERLDLAVSQAGIAAQLAAGVPVNELRATLTQIAPIPSRLQASITDASAVLGQAEWIPSAGFLWVGDPKIRDRLRSKRQTASLFVDPSPPGGLLLRPQVPVEKLAVRCRALGIEVLFAGAKLCAKPSRANKAVTTKKSQASGGRPNPLGQARRSTARE